MRDQLREVRRLGWCHSAITPVGNDQYGACGSINERRVAEFVRIAPDVTSFVIKPVVLPWVDEEGVCRKYSPDAEIVLAASEEALIEFKTKGALLRNPALKTKYEAIGRHLQRQGKKRFGLLEWQWDGHFERNAAMLTRYWNVDPETHAIDAFAAVGRDQVALDELFASVDRDFWPAVWAAVAKQHLVSDWHAGPVTRRTMVSLPGVVRDPVTLVSLISEWWA